MKLTKLVTHTILAIAGIGAIGQAKAATTPTYGNGDLFLTFRQTSGGANTASDYILDLGNVLNFNFNTSFTLSSTSLGGKYGNVGQDLINTYGSDWYTALDSTGNGGTAVLWTVAAGNLATNGSDPANTAYAGANITNNNSALTLNSGGTTLQRGSGGSQSPYINDIKAMAQNDYQGSASTANSSLGFVQASGNSNSYATKLQPNLLGDEAQTNDTLEFDRLATGVGSGQALGDFTLNSNGTLTFTTAAAAVPEPSTWMSLILAGGTVVFLARRRSGLANA